MARLKDGMQSSSVTHIIYFTSQHGRSAGALNSMLSALLFKAKNVHKKNYAAFRTRVVLPRDRALGGVLIII